jgi:V/A-type H+-transporting ATPase subunit A
MRTQALSLLVEEDRLQRIARLVGKEALPENERLVLEAARLIKEGILQQAAFDPIDTFCPKDKQLRMLEVVLHFYERAKKLLPVGCPMIRIQDLHAIEEILRMKVEVQNDKLEMIDAIRSRLDEEMDRLEKDYS